MEVSIRNVKYHILLCGGLCRGRWVSLKNKLISKKDIDYDIHLEDKEMDGNGRG